MKIRNTLILPLIAGSLNLMAQQPWQVGGNSGFSVYQPNNNFLGSQILNNSCIRLGVNGSQDIFIDNNPAQLLPPDASGRPHGGHWIGLGRVFTPTSGPGSWNFFTPKAHLHIDGGTQPGQWGSFGNGIRNWMNTGTLYTENTDAMYVGLRNIGTNFSYAMINWSDDAYGGAGGSDFLSFNFTGGPSGLATSAQGMELGRFNPTPSKGTLGVGNFQFIGASTEPVRRLEILDADPSTGQNANAPQLRTTYTYNATPTGGIFTEFQTTSAGNMYFNTRSNANEKNFGFHKFNPQNCVEISSHAGNLDFGSVNGSSGLRLSNMTSANTPKANPGLGVLSVDANGDVIYVPSAGIANANNGVSVNSGVVQLGVPCTLPGGFPNLGGIVATQFTTDRVIANRNQNFWIASLNSETGGVGIGGQPVLPFCGTGNTFEVSANSKNTKYGSNNASGVRFTKLTSASSTIPNGTNGVNNSKVLTVDQDGDVVLTDAVVGTSIGNACGATANPLTSDWEVPMNSFNMNFTTPANNSSSFNLGNPTCAASIGRMNVYNDNLQLGIGVSSNVNYTTPNFGVYSTISNSGKGHSIGVQGVSNTTFVKNTSVGVKGIASAQNGDLAEGVMGIATTANSCMQNIGVGGLAANGSMVSIAGDFDVEYSNSGLNHGVNIEVINGTNPNAYNIGISSSANTAGLVNYGGYFTASGASGNNYAIYGSAVASGGTPPTGPNYAGYFSGDVVRTGSDNFTSDQNLKQNIDTITNAIGIINQLKPKTFEYKQSSYPSMNLPSGKQYGLIAQDVQSVLPELVNMNTHPAQLDSLGNVVVPSVNYLSLEYQQLIGIMIRGMQQQQSQIKKQDSLITVLSNQINSCCNNNARTFNNPTPTTFNQMDVELSDKDVIVLNQNVPNPFAEQTTITYNVPASVGKAQLIFFNNLGQVIQTVDIKTRGKGKINVFASDLSSGLYNYSLVADGKVIDSKKMVRE